MQPACLAALSFRDTRGRARCSLQLFSAVCPAKVATARSGDGVLTPEKDKGVTLSMKKANSARLRQGNGRERARATAGTGDLHLSWEKGDGFDCRIHSCFKAIGDLAFAILHS